MNPLAPPAPATLLASYEVAALVAGERHWRDRGDWESMAQAYHGESWVRLAWFEGTGAEFVEASRSGGRGGTTRHRLSPSVVCVRGGRAVAETGVLVETRTAHSGIAVDLTVACRYLTLLRRDGGIWRISRVETICERDAIAPVMPGEVLEMDPQRLARYRPSYRFLSYSLSCNGIDPPPDLPGDDRPDLCAPLYQAAEDWLAAASNGSGV
ncbi:nuclear transport factor 2 family protein [Actinomadura rayongensis]|uniref:SnoaL-like domain-containing protein n=1 Tax=Actinomadura rayongensis TaxID=1429076 RepID=A0A6I4WBH8_9ACTN|nr:nuclear transport factor 2 family protein [Actinomadura rayongensis]MXQ67537.1 hypothetical protein [Actinomadura rayongensis]